MAAGVGVNALQSVFDRIAKKASKKNRKISVIHMNKDGSVDFPDNCNTGVLLVPAEMSESEWELQNEIDDQKGKSFSS